jgi:radical SAM protein with 4Fe4S-binding SPASM domain
LELFLGEFGKYVSPGFNIYENDFDIGFFVDLINRFGLVRTLRLGMAHPIYKKDNSYIAARDMAGVLRRIASFYPVFSKLNIFVGLDCGFPLCGLSDSELGVMHKFSKGSLKFRCEPILDIGPDMTVWPCFPLSSVRVRKVYDFNSIREMGEYYRKFHGEVAAEAGGIFQECDDCSQRANGLCSGGCKAHILNRIDREPLKFRKLNLSNDPR